MRNQLYLHWESIEKRFVRATNEANKCCTASRYSTHSWLCLKLAKAVGLAAHGRDIGSGVDSFPPIVVCVTVDFAEWAWEAAAVPATSHERCKRFIWYHAAMCRAAKPEFFPPHTITFGKNALQRKKDGEMLENISFLFFAGVYGEKSKQPKRWIVKLSTTGFLLPQRIFAYRGTTTMEQVFKVHSKRRQHYKRWTHLSYQSCAFQIFEFSFFSFF